MVPASLGGPADRLRRSPSAISAVAVQRWPSAVSFTETSVDAAQARVAQPGQQVDVLGDHPLGVGPSVVSSPRWSIVTSRPASVSRPAAVTTSSVVSPATKRSTTSAVTGALGSSSVLGPLVAGRVRAARDGARGSTLLARRTSPVYSALATPPPSTAYEA